MKDLISPHGKQSDPMLGMDYAKKFCLWNMMSNVERFERFGKEEETYDLVGRLHMD